MLLTIIETNFTTGKNWIFKLKDTGGSGHYAMDDRFYKTHGLKSPITKRHLDTCYKGTTLRSVTTVVDDVSVVTVFE